MDIQKDRPSFVRFETVPKENKKKSAAAGYYVADDVDLALITPAGSKDIFKQEVKDWFAQLERDVAGQRIPQEWMDHYKKAYDSWKRNEEIPVNGTPLKGWLRISPAQADACLRMGIRTVEDLATMNDEARLRLGMGALDLQNIAKAELQAAREIGPVVRENAALKQEVSVLKGSLESLQAQVSVLMQAAGKTTESITAEDILDDPVARYTEKFGKPPHHLMKPETIIQKLNER